MRGTWEAPAGEENICSCGAGIQRPPVAPPTLCNTLDHMRPPCDEYSSKQLPRWQPLCLQMFLHFSKQWARREPKFSPRASHFQRTMKVGLRFSLWYWGDDFSGASVDTGLTSIRAAVCDNKVNDDTFTLAELQRKGGATVCCQRRL